MSESKSQVKPFDIPKGMVWEAYRRVKANKGAPGVDGQSIEQFERDLKNNLFKLWNRMSSGSYFPPPVRAVPIPKAGGRGVRILGVPTVADRVAQTAAAMMLESRVEPIFHPDSYGYRPRRSALDAVATCRKRCWKNDWVIDLDIRAFFDSVDHELLLKAVERHTDQNGCCCMCGGGWSPRCNNRMAPWSPGVAVPRRGRRSHRCWRICSCITRSTCGWSGSSRRSRSNGTAMTR